MKQKLLLSGISVFLYFTIVAQSQRTLKQPPYIFRGGELNKGHL